MSQARDMTTAFKELFEPKVQFPRWFQPNLNIGQILVHSQEEEDQYRARDWAPKPLPGSEVVVPKMDTPADIKTALMTLAAAREQFEAEKELLDSQRKDFEARIEARLSAMGEGSGGSPSTPTPTATASGSPDSADSIGALSDAAEVSPVKDTHKAGKKA